MDIANIHSCKFYLRKIISLNKINVFYSTRAIYLKFIKIEATRAIYLKFFKIIYVERRKEKKEF